MFGQPTSSQTQNPQTTSLFGSTGQGQTPAGATGFTPQGNGGQMNPQGNGQQMNSGGQSAASIGGNIEAKVEMKKKVATREEEEKSRVFSSYKNIYGFLNQAVRVGDNEKKVQEFSSELVERLRNVLGFYDLRFNISQTQLTSEIENLHDKLELSPWMQVRIGHLTRHNQQQPSSKLPTFLTDHLLKSICESLTLSPMKCFDLLQSYFCENPTKYTFLSQLYQRTVDVEHRIMQFVSTQPPIGYQQNPQFLALTSDFQKYKDLFFQQIEETRDLIVQHYLHERHNLIQCLKLITSVKLSDKGSSVSKLSADLFSKCKLIKNLIKSLLRNLNWKSKEFHMMSEQMMGKVFVSLQNEQIEILQLLFTIALEQDLLKGQVKFEVGHLKKFMKYLRLTGFKGWLTDDHDAYARRSAFTPEVQVEQAINESKIKDLGILVMLAMFRIDVFQDGSLDFTDNQKQLSTHLFKTTDKKFEKLRKAINEMTLNPINSIVVLGLQQVVRQIEQFQKVRENQFMGLTPSQQQNLLDQHFMTEISHMLNNSYLFTVPGQSQESRLDQTNSINGEYLKIIKAFLNLIYAPVLLENNMEAAIEEVHHLTMMILLKNPHILRDVWSTLDKVRSGKNEKTQLRGSELLVLNMFSEMIREPMKDLSIYTLLLRQLCGKNRSPFAQYVLMLAQSQRVNYQDGHILSMPEIIKLGDLVVSKTTPLDQELVLAAIILLYQLMLGQMQEQEQFDTLNNLLVIFAKVIKQEPAFYNQVNETFLNVIRGDTNYVVVNHISNANIDHTIEFIFKDNAVKRPAVIEENPALIFLVKSLFVFAKSLDFHLSADTIKHVMDAITSIFSNKIELRKSVINLILENQNETLRLSQFFNRFAFEHDFQCKNLKVSISFLRFITKIFKLDFPYLILNNQMSLHDSLLDEMLQLNYSDLMMNIFQFDFLSAGHFAKFVIRILKLTNVLLGKFDCHNSVMQMNAKSRNPRFDAFLNLCHKHLNNQNLKVMIEILEIKEVRGTGQTNIRQAYIQNKYLAQVMGQTRGEVGQQPSPNAPREKILINKMLTVNLKCLNQIARLGLQIDLHTQFQKQLSKQNTSSKAQKDSRNTKIFYASSLKCVQDLTQQICDLNKQSSLFLKCNLVSLMAFYAGLECVVDDPEQIQKTWSLRPIRCVLIENNVLALEFLKTTCHLWQLQSSNSRIDLSLQLQKNGFLMSEDVKKLFIVPFSVALKEVRQLKNLARRGMATSELKLMNQLLRYLTQMTELLQVCVSSQHSFINHLFSDQQLTTGVETEIQSFFQSGAALTENFSRQDSKSQVKLLAFKLVGLLADMASERQALPFIQAVTGISETSRTNLLRDMVDSYVVPICVKEGVNMSQVDFNVQNQFEYEMEEYAFDFYLQEIVKEEAESQNNAIARRAVDHQQAILASAYFLKLVQALYQISPSESMRLRTIVQELFSHESFVKFFDIQSSRQVSRDLQVIAANLAEINSVFANEDPTKFEFMIQIQRMMERENILSQDQASATQYNHELVSAKQVQGGEARAQNDGNQGQIYLANLNTFRTYQAFAFLQKRIGRDNLSTLLCQAFPSANLANCKGNLGIELAIDTQELKHLLLFNGYSNLDLVNQYVANSQQFNLALSTILSHLTLNQARQQFITTVGLTKLRMNRIDLPKVLQLSQQNRMSHSFHMLASLFPLVDKDFPQSFNQKEMKNSLESLLMMNLNLCKSIFGLLQGDMLQAEREQLGSESRIYVCQKYAQQLFDFLEQTLGALNLCVSQNCISVVTNDHKITSISGVQNLLQFVSDDLLTHFRGVYNYHMDLKGIFGGSNQNELAKNYELTNSALMIQLLIAQIMESITQDQQYSERKSPKQTEGLIDQLSLIISIMAYLGESSTAASTTQEPSLTRQMFKTCLKIFSVYVNLLSEESIHNFMNQGVNQPLKVIIQNLIGKDQDVVDTIEIVQFLTTYAKSESGSNHLMKENILLYLPMNQCIVRAKREDMYINQRTSDEMRNPFHLLHCNVLVLIRTINQTMLDNPRPGTDVQTHLKQLTTFVQTQGLVERIQTLMCFQLSNPKDSITQGQLEEIELLMSIICQLFMHADKLGSANYILLQGLKDCLLFGLTQFFISQKPSKNSNVIVASQSERFMKSHTAHYLQGKQVTGRNSLGDFGHAYTLFEFKSQIHVLKTFISFSASLLNLLLLDKQNFSSPSDSLFPATWSYLSHTQFNLPQNQDYAFSYFAQQLEAEHLQGGYGALVKVAAEMVVESFVTVKMVVGQMEHGLPLKVMLQSFESVFCNDEQVTKEYFGLNSLFMAEAGIDPCDSFDALKGIMETAIQMGECLQKLMFEKVVQCQKQAGSNYFGQHCGITKQDVFDLGKAVLYKDPSIF